MENKIAIPLSLPFIEEDEKKSVLEVMESGWLAHGEFNTKLENEFKKLLNVKHAASMNSCASALEVALKIHNIKGEVILPSFTFVATANAVVNAGATPVFCDVEIDTRNVNASHINCCITENTEAVIVVHYGGQPCDMDEILTVCRKYNLLLIEDSAETLGATWKGKQSGSFGIGCFSFFPTKNITTGEGGMLTCNDNNIYHKAKTLISHGIASSTKDRENEKAQWYRSAIIPGHNYRMSNILAAVGYHQMKKLHMMNDKRISLAQYYNNRIQNLSLDIRIPAIKEGATHVYQMYTIQVPIEKRDNIVIGLRENGIGASVHFYPPVHLQDYYKKTTKNSQNLHNTEILSNSLITLPMYPALTYKNIDYIVEVLKQEFNKNESL